MGNDLPKRWNRICREVQCRQRALTTVLATSDSSVAGDGEPLSDSEVGKLQLAATDLFVEKAQRGLLWQAAWQLALGIVTSVSALAILAFGFIWVARTSALASDQRNIFDLSIRIFKALSLSGFLLFATVYLMQIARANFHEATVNLSRRHGLRFGRLYVYLFAGQLRFTEIEKAFGWTGEFSTAFRDIDVRASQPKAPHEVAVLTAVETGRAAAS